MRLSLAQHRYLLKKKDQTRSSLNLTSFPRIPLIKVRSSFKPCPKSEPEQSVDEELSIQFVHIEGIHNRNKTWSPEKGSLSNRSSKVKIPTHKPLLQDLDIWTESSPIKLCPEFPVAINNWLGGKSNLRSVQREQVMNLKRILRHIDLSQCQRLRESNQSSGIRKWKLLRDVLRSVMLFKHQDAVDIQDNLSEHLHSEHFSSEQNEN